MTLAELEALDTEMLTPAQAAAVTGFSPQTIRTAARDAPWQLPFPVMRVGSRTKIPKAALLAFMRRGSK